jgi:hypothetical protein
MVLDEIQLVRALEAMTWARIHLLKVRESCTSNRNLQEYMDIALYTLNLVQEHVDVIKEEYIHGKT